jgi:uncharacterized protein
MQQLFHILDHWKKYYTRLILSVAALLLFTALVAAPASATGVYQMPSSPGDRSRVLDEAEVLSRATEGKISNDLNNLAKTTGNEVRFVTIRRLDYGETIDSFTDGLFEKWFPTPDDQGNQTLLVMDTLTNNTAMRTGDRVKSILSEEIADSVASETVLVPLRNGEAKYNQAFSDASDRLVAVLSGKPDPGAPQIADNIQVEGTFTKAEETDQGNATIWVVGLLIAATVIPMATYYWYQSMGS